LIITIKSSITTIFIVTSYIVIVIVINVVVGVEIKKRLYEVEVVTIKTTCWVERQFSNCFVY
jgi:hypothetical protein